MSLFMTCRHCGSEFESLSEQTISDPTFEQLKEEYAEEFFVPDAFGNYKIYVTCEQCEQSLSQFPQYYELTKWIQ